MITRLTFIGGKRHGIAEIAYHDGRVTRVSDVPRAYVETIAVNDRIPFVAPGEWAR